jgi:excisionase family DNA binding protein
MTGQQRPGADSETLLTADTAATMLAVSVRSVRRYAEEGRLAPVRIGRAVRYHLADVERLRTAASDTSGQDTEHTGHTGHRPGDTGQARTGPDMSGVAGVSARAVDALREELAALRAENTTLRQELTTKAEAAGMWQGRARTLEERLHQLAPPVAPQPAQDGPGSPETPTVVEPTAPGVWGRLGRWWGG